MNTQTHIPTLAAKAVNRHRSAPVEERQDLVAKWEAQYPEGTGCSPEEQVALQRFIEGRWKAGFVTDEHGGTLAGYGKQLDSGWEYPLRTSFIDFLVDLPG